MTDVSGYFSNANWVDSYNNAYPDFGNLNGDFSLGGYGRVNTSALGVRTRTERLQQLDLLE